MTEHHDATPQKKKPTIAELEAMIEDGAEPHLAPDGTVTVEHPKVHRLEDVLKQDRVIEIDEDGKVHLPEDAPGRLIEMGERIAELETCNAELERFLAKVEAAPESPVPPGGPYQEILGHLRQLLEYRPHVLGALPRLDWELAKGLWTASRKRERPVAEVGPSVVYRVGRLTARDYEEAIQALRDAATQLEPDGRNCVICHDGGHQAWECHHNPLVMARNYVAITSGVWVCFHCGVRFTDEAVAREHFGTSKEEIARCLVAAPTEGDET